MFCKKQWEAAVFARIVHGFSMTARVLMHISTMHRGASPSTLTDATVPKSVRAVRAATEGRTEKKKQKQPENF